MKSLLRSVFGLIPLVVLVWTLVGCDIKPTIQLGGRHLDRETGPVRAQELMSLRKQFGTFLISSDGKPDRTVSYKLDSEDGRVWKESIEQMQEICLRARPNGGIEIDHEIVFDENVRVEYEPPLPLLPPVLEAGKAVQATCRMTVLNLPDGRV